MDNNAQELLKAFEKILKSEENKNKNTFVRSSESSAYGSSSVASMKREVSSRVKAFNEATASGNKFFRTMGEGIPIVKNLMIAMGKGSRDLERAVERNSESYKQAAYATAEYAHRVGINSDELKRVHRVLEEVEKKGKKISDLSKKREELIKEANKGLEDAGIKNRNIAKSRKAFEKAYEKALAGATLEGESETGKKLKKVLEVFKALRTIPDDIKSELQDLNDMKTDPAILELARRDKNLATLLQPVLEGVSDSVGEAATNIERLSEKLKETMGGSAFVMSSMVKDVERRRNEVLDRLGDRISDMTRAIFVATGAAVKTEANMLLTRQRLTGAPMRYSMRSAAVSMGVSETEALTALAENRFLLRRVGAFEGFDGGSDYMRSTEFNRLRQMSVEMGFIGKDALDNILQIAESLRVVGADLGAAAISDTVDFIKNTHKDLGVTQEYMKGLFSDMLQAGAMRLTVAGPGGGSFAEIDSIQKEIELRGKLARVLNQDLEIQKKRVEQQKSLAFGDPVQAIQTSVSSQILAGAVGMQSGDVGLLGRYLMHGGADMSEAERLTAIPLVENLRIRIGGALSEAASQGDVSRRAVLTQLMGQAGITYDEATGAFSAANGQLAMGPEDILSSGMANTTKEVQETNILMRGAMRATELTQGLIKSSAGGIVTAIYAGLGGATIAIIQAMALNRALGGGSMIPAKLRGLGGKIARNAPRMLKGGAIGIAGNIAASTLLSPGPASSALQGASTGAGLGMYFGPVGAVLGGVAGGLIGHGLETSARRKEQETNINSIMGVDRVREFRSEQRTTAERYRQESREAAQAGDYTRSAELLEKANNIESGKATDRNDPRTNTTAQLLQKVEDNRRRQLRSLSGAGITFSESDRAVSEQLHLDVKKSFEAGTLQDLSKDELQRLSKALRLDGDETIEGEREILGEISQLLEKLNGITNDQYEQIKQNARRSEDRFNMMRDSRSGEDYQLEAQRRIYEARNGIAQSEDHYVDSDP